MISKFASLEELNRIEEIVKTLQKMTNEKKEEEIVELKVKNVNSLIDDLNLFVENVKELNAKVDESNKDDKPKGDKDDPEDKSDADKKTEEDSEKTEDKTEDAADADKSDESDADKKKAEDGDEGAKKDSEDSSDDNADDGEKKVDNESKFKTLCTEYSASLKEAETLLGVKDQIITKLTQDNAELVTSISKFEQEKILKEKGEYDSLMDKTVESYAKFNKLKITDTKVLDQKAKWITSKMSKFALAEIGEAYNMQVTSKYGKEPKVETVSSESLSNIEESKEFSKLSADEKLDVIANRVAKAAGFRE